MAHNDSGKVWKCTEAYGHLETNKKHHTWILLERLAGIFSYHWCCFGDFNEVVHLHERSRGSDRNLNIVSKFREVV